MAIPESVDNQALPKHHPNLGDRLICYFLGQTPPPFIFVSCVPSVYSYSSSGEQLRLNTWSAIPQSISIHHSSIENLAVGSAFPNPFRDGLAIVPAP